MRPLAFLFGWRFLCGLTSVHRCKLASACRDAVVGVLLKIDLKMASTCRRRLPLLVLVISSLSAALRLDNSSTSAAAVRLFDAVSSTPRDIHRVDLAFVENNAAGRAHARRSSPLSERSPNRRETPRALLRAPPQQHRSSGWASASAVPSLTSSRRRPVGDTAAQAATASSLRGHAALPRRPLTQARAKGRGAAMEDAPQTVLIRDCRAGAGGEQGLWYI